MKAIDFTADNRLKYKARLLTGNDRFGLNGCLNHLREHTMGPVVEFYVQTGDTVHKDLAWAGVDEPWHFVSRYYLTSYRGNQDRRHTGLCLSGYEPEFNLSADDCAFVDLWLKKVHGV
jgi:hypothetical protein